MVVFTCNNCGESVQKPKVAKHYQFQCRSSENLTCVDCHKDFFGQEYVVHTKCVTESERYGGQDFVARPGQNKGEKKQQEWINVVKNVFDTATNLTREEKHVLDILSKYDNIPRKKAKFLNFIRNIMGPRVTMSVIDSVWTQMETAFKGPARTNDTPTQNTNGKANGNSVENISSPTKNHENNIAENQNNENIVRENGNTEENERAANGDGKKKKSKKRDLIEPKSEDTEAPVSKKKKKKTEEENSEDATTAEQEDNQETAKFDWKAVILEIVSSKEEITVKKLRKKVVNRYLNHCGNTVTLEKATSRFDKKLRKTSEIVINDDKIRLV